MAVLVEGGMIGAAAQSPTDVARVVCGIELHGEWGGYRRRDCRRDCSAPEEDQGGL